MFFGITIEKLLLIGVIAALLIGPERLPRYAESLARFTRRTRDFLQGAKTRVRDEMGSDFDDVDWRSLDPRQYDPRRIIREALLDDAPVATVRAAQAASVVTAMDAAPVRKTSLTAGEQPPFDSEAT
ncbi:Sec-independent protein translocase TatB [Microbacterium sp. ET2]|uniref:Sec-independent protein translocase TatB n=1 Tax=Microbacterium albipurpureum TaxID=3050384 RepID=UPI00259CA7D9|nr:Sec-independent protein translocase TatB [Microbacterium sp. ET2 (Ac-2212)]WJL95935.1 Sec-independent protein translocase TatB [Microbacterium sp. ET2 (Ac-2212)]